jgi:hypothetical protein
MLHVLCVAEVMAAYLANRKIIEITLLHIGLSSDYLSTS